MSSGAGDDVASEVRQHYGPEGVTARVQQALAALGVQEAKSADVLAGVDEFHVGSRQATQDLFGRLRLVEGSHVLDIGCGLGGTVRSLVVEHGCRAVGIDLTPAYIELARSLTDLLGLRDRVTFEVADASRLPFGERSFDGATMLHVGMNIADKAAVFREVQRAVRPGGFFGLYDVMQTGAAGPAFPVPWASVPAISFLAAPADYRRMLEEAGLTITSERDMSHFALEFFATMRAHIAEHGLPPLGPHLLMGETFRDKIGNIVKALEAGEIAPVQMICQVG